MKTTGVRPSAESGDDAEGVVDRRADVAVGGAEQRRHAEHLVQALPFAVSCVRAMSPSLGVTSACASAAPASTTSRTPATSWTESGQTPPHAPRTMSSTPSTPVTTAMICRVVQHGQSRRRARP